LPDAKKETFLIQKSASGSIDRILPMGAYD
jgi:hypothetical protein